MGRERLPERFVRLRWVDQSIEEQIPVSVTQHLPLALTDQVIGNRERVIHG